MSDLNLYIGLMSGTSMDGIDAALINAKKNALIAGLTTPYPKKLQEQLLDFDVNKKYTPKTILELNQKLGQAFANAALALLKQTTYTAKDITAIGSHGQTLFHNPDEDIPTTLQLACPHTIAENTGITVVADFRTRDLVLGGQGAPFAPYYHQELLKNTDLPAVIINIGGISNISILKQSAPPLGYDTGPGNTLMDSWIKKHQNIGFDENGDWAASGNLIPSLLKKLLADDFFKKRGPKSIDKAYYSLNWLEQHLDAGYQPEDIQATLLHLTAHSIADTIKAEASDAKQILLCGGGVHNVALKQALINYLPNQAINTTQAFDINPDYLEAMMFAWLAEQAILKQPVDLTQITGSNKPSIMGVIHPYYFSK
jgi:anhydro-N-acetylmuramic acid kinase